MTPVCQRQKCRVSLPPLRRLLAWGVPLLLVLAVVAVFAGKAAVAAYLRSESFRAFLARKVGSSLHAQVEVTPLDFTGLNMFCDRLHARGEKDAAFAELRLDGVRAELSARRFFDRVWQVESVDVERLDWMLDGSRIESPAIPVSKTVPRQGGLLPNRVEIAQAQVREATVRWAAGGIAGVALQFTPQDGGWKIAGAGGKIEQAGLPALDVQRVRLLYRAPSLFVQEAELRQPAGGAVNVTGEVNFEQMADLRATLSGIALAPFLAEDWRVRLRGEVSGEVTVHTPLPARAPPEIRGTLTLAQGQLEALPVLDEIAVFTRTQQFRQLTLTRASADFRHTGDKLAVSNFVAEAAGLMRIEGSFTVEHAAIDGAFEVGVTASSLQWLPGSQERVFTASRGGYLWTPMHLTGPLAQPRDDLTPRLVAAAGGAVIDTARGAVQDTIKTGKDVLKSALDLLLPK